MISHQTTHFLPCPKYKEFADNKFNVAQNMKFVFHREENIVGKDKRLSCLLSDLTIILNNI